MKFINPYNGINFGTVTRVKAISHEHIVSTSRLKNAYDRGIRYFAAVNYTPAAVSYPLDNFSQIVRDWCYLDVSEQFPDGGDNGDDRYSTIRARKNVPSFYSYHQQGLVITYKNLSNERVYEKLISDPSGIEWSDVCADDSAWRLFPASELQNELVLVDCVYTSGFPSFTDKDGNTVDTSSLVQLPNSEHTRIRYDFDSDNGVCPHLNVLGTLWNEPSHSYKKSNQFTYDYPIHDLPSLNLNVLDTEKQLFEGKIFGTINHTGDVSVVRKVLNGSPNVFKAMELFNQYYSPTERQSFRNAYDALLREGFRIWGTSVVDWQGARTPESEAECPFDRGCNVLLINGYDSISGNNAKSEAGLDAYLDGRFYASGLGNHYITELSTFANTVFFSVDGSPSKIQAITSGRTIEGTGNTMSVDILPEETYIRFEVFYYDNEKTDMDFIFTNPVFIEDNGIESVIKTPKLCYALGVL